MTDTENDRAFQAKKTELIERQKTYCQLFQNTWKCFNKVQDLGVLKMYFSYACYGLPERPEEDVTVTECADMYLLYSDEQQSRVKNISELIFSNTTDSVVNLGHTYLLCLMDIKKEFPTVVFHFRQGESVKFVDMNCRLYVDWEDFTKNNQLPDCMYYAPKDGLYRSKAEIWYYYSPASTVSSKVLKNTDLAVGAVGLTTAVAGFLVAGPAILAAGTTCMVYGGVRSVYNLVDRHSHEQSVGLLDTEARWSWLNLTTSGLTGVSSVATSNAARIIEYFGNYGNVATRTLQTLNIATLIVDVGALSMSTYQLYEKFWSEEGISPMDVMHLGVQALMLYGAVVSVRRTHEFLSRTSSTTLRVSDKTLTKTQKRNLQRKNAKRRQNGLPVITRDTVTVSAVRADSYQFWAKVNAYVGYQILKLNYPRGEAILVLAENIFSLVTDFSRGNMDSIRFVELIIPHLKNAQQWFQDEKENLLRCCTEFKNYCEQFLSHGGSVDDVSNIYSIIDNAIIRCNSVELDLPEFVVSLAAIPSSVGLYPVFEVARDLAFKCKTDGTMKSYIETFHNSILFVINKLKHVIESSVSFDEIYDLNKEMYGEVLANKMLDSINVCSENDYMNKILLEKTVELCRQTEVECEFLNSHSTFMGQEFNAKICDSLLDIYYSFVKNFFPNDQWNISNSEAVLRRLLDYLTPSLTRVDWWRTVDNWRWHDDLVNNFPMAEITSLCASGNSTIESSFDRPNDASRDDPDDLEIQPELLDKYNVILQLAVRLMQKIKDTVDLPENEFVTNHQKLITYFLVNKLATEIKDELHGGYKRNEDVFGIRYAVHMYESVKPINDERRDYLFDKIIQNYNNQIETMVSEYLDFYIENRYSRNVDHVRIWSSILDDSEATYEINCQSGRDEEYYKGIINNVMQINTFQVVEFVETTNFIALKFQEPDIEECTSVTFYFSSNDKAFVVAKKLVGQFND